MFENRFSFGSYSIRRSYWFKKFISFGFFGLFRFDKKKFICAPSSPRLSISQDNICDTPCEETVPKSQLNSQTILVEPTHDNDLQTDDTSISQIDHNNSIKNDINMEMINHSVEPIMENVPTSPKVVPSMNKSHDSNQTSTDISSNNLDETQELNSKRHYINNNIKRKRCFRKSTDKSNADSELSKEQLNVSSNNKSDLLNVHIIPTDENSVHNISTDITCILPTEESKVLNDKPNFSVVESVGSNDKDPVPVINVNSGTRNRHADLVNKNNNSKQSIYRCKYRDNYKADVGCDNKFDSPEDKKCDECKINTVPKTNVDDKYYTKVSLINENISNDQNVSSQNKHDSATVRSCDSSVHDVKWTNQNYYSNRPKYNLNSNNKYNSSNNENVSWETKIDLPTADDVNSNKTSYRNCRNNKYIQVDSVQVNSNKASSTQKVIRNENCDSISSNNKPYLCVKQNIGSHNKSDSVVVQNEGCDFKYNKSFKTCNTNDSKNISSVDKFDSLSVDDFVSFDTQQKSAQKISSIEKCSTVPIGLNNKVDISSIWEITSPIYSYSSFSNYEWKSNDLSNKFSSSHVKSIGINNEPNHSFNVKSIDKFDSEVEQNVSLNNKENLAENKKVSRKKNSKIKRKPKYIPLSITNTVEKWDSSSNKSPSSSVGSCDKSQSNTATNIDFDNTMSEPNGRQNISSISFSSTDEWRTSSIGSDDKNDYFEATDIGLNNENSESELNTVSVCCLAVVMDVGPINNTEINDEPKKFDELCQNYVPTSKVLSDENNFLTKFNTNTRKTYNSCDIRKYCTEEYNRSDEFDNRSGNLLNDFLKRLPFLPNDERDNFDITNVESMSFTNNNYENKIDSQLFDCDSGFSQKSDEDLSHNRNIIKDNRSSTHGGSSNQIRCDSKKMMPPDADRRKVENVGAKSKRSNDKLKHVKPMRVLVSELAELMRHYPEGMWCKELLQAYKAMYSEDLQYSAYGYRSVANMCRHLTTVFKITEPITHGQWRLFYANLVVPPQFMDGAGDVPQKALEQSESDVKPTVDEVVFGLLALPGVAVDWSLYPEDCAMYGEAIHDPLPVPSSFLMQISNIEDPSHFWFQVISNSASVALNTLTIDMTYFYYEHPDAEMYKMIRAAARPSQLVAVPNGDKGKFRRAVVIKNVSYKIVKVYHLDYGIVADVEWTKIYMLLNDFCDVAVQGHRGRLSGVAPRNGKWTPRAIERFTELVDSINLQGYVYTRSDDENSIIALKMNICKTNKDVASHLVMENLGVAVTGNLMNAKYLKSFDSLENALF